MLNKILKTLYIVLFFVTPLLIFRDTSELFEFNKMIFIYLITCLVLFLWTLKMILLKRIILNKTQLFIPILLFIFSLILATIFSIDTHTSIFGYYGRFNGGLISIIAYLILFFAYVSNFDKHFTKILLKASLISSVLVMLWGIPGKFGYDLTCLIFTGQFDNSCWTEQFKPAERMFSTLGQPNWLGAYLAINFFIGLYFLIKNSTRGVESRLCQGLLITYLFCNFAVILFTRSRSAILSVVVGLGLFYLFLLYKERKKIISLKALHILSFLLILAVMFFKTGINQVDQYFDFNNSNHQNVKPVSDQQAPKTAINIITPSSEIRQIVWTASWDLIKKYPLFGTGPETFAYSYYFARPPAHNLTSEWDYLYNKAHNEYINYLATTGIVGFGAYAFIIVCVLVMFMTRIFNFQFSIFNKKFKKLNIKNSIQISNLKFQTGEIDNQQLLLVYLLLSYLTILITNFFGFSITVTNLYFFLIPAILIVSYNGSNTIGDTPGVSKIVKTSKNQKILIAISSLFTIYLIISISLYFFSDLKYAQANNDYKSGDYANAYRNLNSALSWPLSGLIPLPFIGEHVYEDKLSYILANLAFFTATEKKMDLAKQEILLSEYYNIKSLEASPLNVLYWKTRSKNAYLFYQVTSDEKNLEIAQEALGQASKLSPTDPKIPYSKALFLSIQFDAEKDKTKKNALENLSLKEIDHSIALKSNFLDGYFFKGQLLKKYGRKNEAKQIFEHILKNLDPNDQEAKKEFNSL